MLCRHHPPQKVSATEAGSRKVQMRLGIVKKVYESMMRRIVIGEFVQGEVLTDLGLADQFNSSRTPIREACIHLAKEGFLRVIPGRGYMVTEISLDDVRELYQLRLMLEPSAAELAARASLREDFFLTSSKLLVTFEKDYAKRTYEDFLEYGNAEYSFHCGIAKASGNKRLAKIMAELMNQYRRFHYVTFQKESMVENDRGSALGDPGGDPSSSTVPGTQTDVRAHPKRKSTSVSAGSGFAFGGRTTIGVCRQVFQLLVMPCPGKSCFLSLMQRFAVR